MMKKSFANSPGWNRIPISIQRVDLFAVCPQTRTDSIMPAPTRRAGTDRRRTQPRGMKIPTRRTNSARPLCQRWLRRNRVSPVRVSWLWTVAL